MEMRGREKTLNRVVPLLQASQVAKGKAKLMKYDWSDVRFQGNSEDDDYKLA
jgi:hypothetical protein